jgi:hypothetical protein
MKTRSRPVELDLADLGNPALAGNLPWQSLWVALLERPWTTLAVVPVGHASLAEDVVTQLLETSRSITQLPLVPGDLPRDEDRRGRRMWPTSSPLLFPAAALLARRADAVVVVAALLGDTVEQVRRVRDMVGAARILGCVVARRIPAKDVVHGAFRQRGDGNVQPPDGAGTPAGRPVP